MNTFDPHTKLDKSALCLVTKMHPLKQYGRFSYMLTLSFKWNPEAWLEQVNLLALPHGKSNSLHPYLPPCSHSVGTTHCQALSEALERRTTISRKLSLSSKNSRRGEGNRCNTKMLKVLSSNKWTDRKTKVSTAHSVKKTPQKICIQSNTRRWLCGRKTERQKVGAGRSMS